MYNHCEFDGVPTTDQHAHEVEQQVDELFIKADQITFDALNRILDEIHRQGQE